MWSNTEKMVLEFYEKFNPEGIPAARGRLLGMRQNG